LHRQHDVDI